MTILTAVQAGKIIGVHANTVSAYARDGRIEGQKISKTWYFDDETVKEFARTYAPPTHGGARPRTQAGRNSKENGAGNGKPKRKRKAVKQDSLPQRNFASGKARGRIVPTEEVEPVEMDVNGRSCVYYPGSCPPEKAFDWAASVGK